MVILKPKACVASRLGTDLTFLLQRTTFTL